MSGIRPTISIQGVLGLALLGLLLSPAQAELKGAISVSPKEAAWGYPVYFDAFDSLLPDGKELSDFDILWDFGDGRIGDRRKGASRL